jgi:hypothetical protein
MATDAPLDENFIQTVLPVLTDHFAQHEIAKIVSVKLLTFSHTSGVTILA